MSLLLCSATELEIRPLLNRIKQFKDLEILITGVGSTAATYSITKAVNQNKPSFMIQAGMAGCLDPNIDLNMTVAIKNEMIGDLGVNESGKFHSIIELGLLEPDQFPWKNGQLANPHPQLHSCGLLAVDAVTVNEISTQSPIIAYYKSLGAQVESMEGAAFHYVALQEKIPFLQVRSLSNFAGERDKNRWKMKEAIENLDKELDRLLNKFL